VNIEEIVEKSVLYMRGDDEDVFYYVTFVCDKIYAIEYNVCTINEYACIERDECVISKNALKKCRLAFSDEINRLEREIRKMLDETASFKR